MQRRDEFACREARLDARCFKFDQAVALVLHVVLQRQARAHELPLIVGRCDGSRQRRRSTGGLRLCCRDLAKGRLDQAAVAPPEIEIVGEIQPQVARIQGAAAYRRRVNAIGRVVLARRIGRGGESGAGIGAGNLRLGIGLTNTRLRDGH